MPWNVQVSIWIFISGLNNMELLAKPHAPTKIMRDILHVFPTLLLSNENCDANANAMRVAGLGRRKPISFSKDQTPTTRIWKLRKECHEKLLCMPND